MTIKRTETLPDQSEVSAIYSEDLEHRFMLTQSFPGHKKGSGHPLFILSHPPTSGSEMDDQATKRCAAFAHEWGYTAFRIACLSSHRGSALQEIADKDETANDAIAHKVNDEAIARAAAEADIIVCAWGTKAADTGDDVRVLHQLAKYADKLQCLRVTKDGHPAQPQNISASARPIPFTPDVLA